MKTGLPVWKLGESGDVDHKADGDTRGWGPFGQEVEETLDRERQ